MLSYAEIEDAVVERLADLRERRLARAVASYNGEFSSDSFAALHLDYPRVYVCVSALNMDTANLKDACELTVQVHILSRNLRGERAARTGDALTAGAYELAEAVRERLHRWCVGSGMMHLVAERVLQYSMQAALCIFRCEYRLPQRNISTERI